MINIQSLATSAIGQNTPVERLVFEENDRGVRGSEDYYRVAQKQLSEIDKPLHIIFTQDIFCW
jgi:hypothetical protein